MAIVLFDAESRNALYPYTYTKAIADIRFGIFTQRERWQHLMGGEVLVATADYLACLYPPISQEEHLWIDAQAIVNDDLLSTVQALATGDALFDGKKIIACKVTGILDISAARDPSFHTGKIIQQSVTLIEHPWQLMQWNDQMIRFDYSLITKGRISQPIPADVQAINPGQIFIEDDAKLQLCTLNAATGPIYIGKNAEIMEGTAIRGPFVLGDHSVVKLNSRIYGATTFGPFCMGGGEIKNTVMMGYSNKAHDGYLGDAVVGEWCNFGAGSTNSNIKNTAGEIKIWDMGANTYCNVGQKCGVIVGDYSRISINASINTGTMIGVSANVFGAGLLPTIFNNFSWGSTGIVYEFSKALEAIQNWKKLKQQELTVEQSSVLKHIFASI
jgi:UDP-N-acetylglucosamine diphosphorylase/glucosamine-1-phosphate N-acetyltransferase